MEYSVEINDLTKNFGGFCALKNINLKITPGEVFAYIGPNGAGKSTTIRILLGILQATKGSARLFGKDAWKDAVEIHKRIAYVPGDVNLWPNLTGGEVIDLFVNLREKENKELRNKLVADFNLDPSKKCRTYSKGNRQKVALIAAFASDADLYILDEPTSGLDPLMEQVFQDYVERQKKAGKGVFLSSHIMSEVERLCDRVGIIREGEIARVGTLDELRSLSRYVVSVSCEREIDGLEKIEGVFEFSSEYDSYLGAKIYNFNADANKMGAIINHIAQFGIKKLDSRPPSLEDLFMSHYEK